MAESKGDPGIMALGLEVIVGKSRQHIERGIGDRHHLEHRSHAAAAALGQPLQRAGNVFGNFGRGLGHQGRRALVDAEAFEEFALRHRAVHPCAKILGGAHQRLEIDMGGDVGLARIFQGIGKAVAGDGLKGIASIAAQMAVIDDQRGAAVVADPGRDLHDLRVGPPLEHRADRGRAHQRRQQHLETRHRLGGCAEGEVAVGADLDGALVPAALAFHHLVHRQHVEIFTIVLLLDQPCKRHTAGGVPGWIAAALSKSHERTSHRETSYRLEADKLTRVRRLGTGTAAIMCVSSWISRGRDDASTLASHMH